MAKKLINDKLRKEIEISEGGETEKQILRELLELEIGSDESRSVNIDDYEKIVNKHLN